MRVQVLVSLALLQLQSCAAAAGAASGSSSNAMVDTSSNHGMATHPSGHGGGHGGGHGNKPSGGHGASTGSFQGGASSHQGPKKGKGLPRMVDFPHIHLSPVEGGVRLNPPSTVTQGSAMQGSATQDKRRLPMPTGGYSSLDCPIIARRGDFLLRRCPEEMSESPYWTLNENEPSLPSMEIAKKRASTTSEVWTRSDGLQSYWECGALDRRGNFAAKRCPEDILGGPGPVASTETNLPEGFEQTAASAKTRASRTTTGQGLWPSGVRLPSSFDDCDSTMGRRGDLLVRRCCVGVCDMWTNIDGDNDGGQGAVEQ